MVCPPLATGGHPVSSTGQALSGGADPSVRGNPAPVVRPRHRPHHTRPAGPLLLDHPGRPRVAGTSSHHPAHCGLVRQTVADFRGCHRPGASPPVAGLGGFITVSRLPRCTGTPRHFAPPNGGFPRLRSLNCAKSSLAPGPLFLRAKSSRLAKVPAGRRGPRILATQGSRTVLPPTRLRMRSVAVRHHGPPDLVWRGFEWDCAVIRPAVYTRLIRWCTGHQRFWQWRFAWRIPTDGVVQLEFQRRSQYGDTWKNWERDA